MTKPAVCFDTCHGFHMKWGRTPSVQIHSCVPAVEHTESSSPENTNTRSAWSPRTAWSTNCWYKGMVGVSMSALAYLTPPHGAHGYVDSPLWDKDGPPGSATCRAWRTSRLFRYCSKWTCEQGLYTSCVGWKGGLFERKPVWFNNASTWDDDVRSCTTASISSAPLESRSRE